MNIYQLFPRVFGNKNDNTVFDGDKEKNGCGTFADIDDTAIEALKSLGITHIWLTGVLRHASLTAYPELGINATHWQITKGKAGSPYAIVDYYDIDPDLAIDPDKRMKEFEELVRRIHDHGLKVIIDFVPNHLAREYKSICRPAYVEDFGAHDNVMVSFSTNNNFYYCPQQKFVLPYGVASDVSDYQEYPAKASGNDVFVPTPSVNDWYDTVKLNYGIDYSEGRTYFEDIPDTWHKMLHVLRFWCSKDIDGFRVDMAEMVPVEFWAWVLDNIHREYDVVMIAEIYRPDLYRRYLDAGFDYLYDKVGLYNTLENICRHKQRADSITDTWKALNGLDDRMLRFMENHDEQRVASEHFYGDSFKALPAVTVSALMNRGPFMIYDGQESGEDARGSNGFSGDDGRTSIFDYVTMPKHQRWMNNGAFDGGGFDKQQKKLYEFYKRLLNLRLDSDAIRRGEFYDLMWANPWYSDFDPQFVYAFLRYYNNDRLLVVVNFNDKECRDVKVKIPSDALSLMKVDVNSRWILYDVFNDCKIDVDIHTVDDEGVPLLLEPSDVKVMSLREFYKK